MDDTSHLGWEESRLSILFKPISKIGKDKDGVLIEARGLEYDFDHIAEIVTDRMTYHRENRHH